ncbi:YpdA family putative bacillithiol disulfide reductase [Thermus thermamylovorans]|uniref:YpdA family putative bacillithiol disulfide reductase n=1 Tax=Thermus thermamylovorans TaxID=2509362 RepID=A0A4Q9B7X1_9DEIN|nr:YpdA family putative bacillithiol disulfide reductase [Thermus thermamylovorans]TBH21716.1 YpdA family putative bacillithiol disulfide reductase [Thermus thermamylovorans]
MVDVLVVGAGPVGLAAALEAKRLGLAHLVLERGAVAETVYRFPRQMVFFSESKHLEIGGHPLVAHGPKPTRLEALLYYQKVAEREGLRILPYTEAVGIEGGEGDYRILARDRKGEKVFAARYVVLATGYFGNPNRLGVPGEGLPHVLHRYEEAFPFFGQKVAVVGGSNSAVEAALDLYRAGARVTLVHRGKWVRPSVKYWLLPDFENRVKEGSILAVMEARVRAITPEGLLLERPSGEAFLEADFVLVQIGYRAEDHLLKAAQVAYEGERPLLSPEFETSRPGLFAIGSCAFGPDTRSVFIENGREHARLALAAIARRGY